MFGPQRPTQKVLLWYFGRLGYKDRLQTYTTSAKVSHLSTHINWTEGYQFFVKESATDVADAGS